MRRRNVEIVPLRIVNERTGEVFDFWHGWSMRQAKKYARGFDKHAKFTDLKVYRNVRNPLYK